MPNADIELLTIQEFCKFARISRATFYHLDPKPPVIKMGGKRLISKSSAIDWLNSLELEG